MTSSDSSKPSRSRSILSHILPKGKHAPSPGPSTPAASASESEPATAAATPTADAVSPSDQVFSSNYIAHSGTMSSCELFAMFKTMAAGRRRSKGRIGRSSKESSSEEDEMETPPSEEDAGALAPSAELLASVPPPSRPKLDRTASWVDKERAKMQMQVEVDSSKFAALSMSNESPFSAIDEVVESPAPTLTDPALSSTYQPSAEEKLAAIREEFGEIASIMVDANGNAEEERLLAECSGLMYKGVLMVGLLHLTTHRLTFHALQPPDGAFVRRYDQARDAADYSFGAAVSKTDIIHAGPVTWHRQNHMAQRVWVELNAEMITTYPSGDDAGRVRPLKSILLTSIHRLSPLDAERPADFHITYESDGHLHTAYFTVDTEQSAVQWRRDIESALFRVMRLKWRHNRSVKEGAPRAESGETEWTTLRFCIPLDRASLFGVSDFHDFATLIGMDVELDRGTTQFLQPELVARGEYHAAAQAGFGPPKPFVEESGKKLSLHRLSEGFGRVKTPSPASTPSVQPTLENMFIPFQDTVVPPQGHGIFTTKLIVLNQIAWFPEALQQAVTKAHARKVKPGIKRPEMVFQVAGFDCLTTDQELDATTISDAEEVPQVAKLARKEEKATMAGRVFGLQQSEGIWLKRCYALVGGVPLRGHIILTPRYICFWRRMLVGADIKYRFRTEDVKGVETEPGNQPGFHGLALKLHGSADVRFEFWQKQGRDQVMERISEIAGGVAANGGSTPHDLSASPTDSEGLSPMSATASSPSTIVTRASDILSPPKELLFKTRQLPDRVMTYLPFMANKPWASRTMALSPRTFALLTIGSRGDVQPYIALGLRLKKDGHRVIIVTHDEFKKWIESYGLEHRQAGGDPTALMKLSAEHKMFSPGFFKETLGSFRQWLDELLIDSYEACRGCDVLIESPSAMAGIHIAEKLQIPYFRAFTMPWTRTTAYPQAFMVPAFEMGPSFNYSTYVLYDNIIWKATAGQINRWRRQHLGLGNTDMSALSQSKVPFLYNFSPAVVPKPLDWHDDIVITGYWVLEDSDADWSPPPELEAFMRKAKEDGKALVYIGFGSIVVPKPNEMTRSIIRAVEKAGVRAIIAKGWSSRGGDPAKEGEDIQFPDCCYGLDKVPHGWLFPRVQAALHHGGAGTVGASLRAGIPTLIKPWFGDQYFWANRVTKLEVGLKIPSLRSDDIADALTKATTNRVMIEKAARIGEAIRKEAGVENAVEAIHYNILRAASDRTKMEWAK